ncbi:hypothetical protein [Herbaspirillum rubrisubalbicans]|uniref:hypothetical protein n=1 Tax=Herbaspirillum rubrisubalbicans TaxID=80842 RepID=UPI0012E35F2E|nr:hypothetical protein [Herbaspirillum rubrisubalbicans]
MDDLIVSFVTFSSWQPGATTTQREFGLYSTQGRPLAARKIDRGLVRAGWTKSLCSRKKMASMATLAKDAPFPAVNNVKPVLCNAYQAV